MARPAWIERLERAWMLWHLAEPEFAYMFDPPPPGEWVAVDCETTGLDPTQDRIIAIGAVRIAGRKVLASERLELIVRPERRLSAESVRVHMLRERDVAQGIDRAKAMRSLLAFIGSRPLVGYFLEFDVAMLNREIWPLLGVRLPQPKIEVSSMYYDLKNRALPATERGTGNIDLRFATMMEDLGLPLYHAHDAVNDAIMAALAFIKLRALLGHK